MDFDPILIRSVNNIGDPNCKLTSVNVIFKESEKSATKKYILDQLSKDLRHNTFRLGDLYGNIMGLY
jgi:hypothetical protein